MERNQHEIQNDVHKKQKNGEFYSHFCVNCVRYKPKNDFTIKKLQILF